MSERKISPIAQARMAALVNAVLEQAEMDAAVSTTAVRALKSFTCPDDVLALLHYSDEVIEKAGWTRDELMIAYHSMQNPNKQPVALKMSHERHINRMRAGVHERVQADQSAQSFVVIPAAQPLPTAIEAVITNDDEE